MDDARLWAVLMQRVGGWCAIAGAALSVAAGIGYGGVTYGREPEAVLQHLAALPVWYWPTVHLAFVGGAVLWIVAFMGLNTWFRDMPARILGQFGMVTLLLGSALLAIDSFVSGSALAALAAEWAAAPPTERSEIVQSTDTLLTVLGATWIGIVVLFHGVPFVLTGTAVARSAPFPRSLRWIGVMAGAGSVLSGTLMFAAPSAVPPTLFFVFGAVGALWMVGIGIFLKRPFQPERHTREARQVA